MRVADCQGVRLTDGDASKIGFEIEMEGKCLPANLPSWRVEADHSLYNGLEYVLYKPMPLNGFDRACDELMHNINKKSEFKYSPRAGIHCHINVAPLSLDHFVKFIVCYYIVEELLVGWCGKNRENNLFCLRAVDTDEVIEQFVVSCCNKDFTYMDENFRYAAMNFNSLQKFGTVEFRAMETRLNVEDWKILPRILHRTLKSSLKFQDVKDIITQGSLNGPIDMARDILGEDYFDIIKGNKDLQAVESIIFRGIRLAQEIAFLANTQEVEKSTNPFAMHVARHINPYEVKAKEYFADELEGLQRHRPHEARYQDFIKKVPDINDLVVAGRHIDFNDVDKGEF